MPRLNISGDWCAGIGGGVVSVNGQIIATASGAAGWMDARRVIYQNCSHASGCRVETYNYLNAEVVTVLAHGANFVEGGGGVWAAWFGTPDPSTVGVTTSYGARFPTAGLGPVGPDGAVALKVEYQSYGPWDVVEVDGTRWQLTPGDARMINLCGQHRAVWADERGVVSVNMPKPFTISGLFWWLRVLEIEGVWWALYQADDARLVLHPFDSFYGYVVASGNTFRPDLCHLSGIGVRVVWALSEGEPPQDVRTRDISLAEARIDLTQVPPDPKPPDPIQKPPVLTVHFYEPLLKAGVPWAVDFSNDGDGTRFVVSKDERDQLWIEAENDAGSTATGLIRQLTVEGPDVTPEPEPEPEPPPMHSQSRFWLHPNIGSKDLLDVFDDMSALANVDVFGLYVQEILTDVSNPQLGTNIWPNLVAHDVVRKLAQAGIPLAIELGAVKPGDCLAQGNISGMQTALQRVHDAGGVVGYLTMDEPLTANQQSCGGNLDQCADAVAAFIHSAAAIDPDIKVGWIEAWPEVAYNTQSIFLEKLKARNALPTHWHLDIDWNRAAHEKKNPSAFIELCQTLADSYGIALGLQVNSTKDPLATDAEHHANLDALAEKLHGILPDAARVVTQSWATRTGATQDLPNNLGGAGLLASFTITRSTFELTPPEPPQPEVNPMLYKLMDPTTHGVIRVKSLKALDGGKFTAILPDDRVVSIQPDGSFETRDAGTTGEYEQCYAADGLLFYAPQGKLYSWAYRLLPV